MRRSSSVLLVPSVAGAARSRNVRKEALDMEGERERRPDQEESRDAVTDQELAELSGGTRTIGLQTLCKVCGYDNLLGVRKCEKCGNPLERYV